MPLAGLGAAGIAWTAWIAWDPVGPCGNWWRAGRGQLAELGLRVALLEEQARRREEELAGAGRWIAKTGGGPLRAVSSP